MKFAIVCEATDPSLTPHLLMQWASALSDQASTDFATLWEVSPSEVEYFASILDIPTLADQPYSISHIVDFIPEAPGALAYHTVDLLGRPMLKMGWETIKQNGGGLKDLSVAISHEVLETIGDPYCSFYSPWTDGVKFVALEVCDPVEGDTYEKDGVTLSSFVGPRWFNQSGAGPYDFLRKLSAPFSLSPGGYVAFDDGTQLFGENVTEAKQKHKLLYGRRAKAA